MRQLSIRVTPMRRVSTLVPLLLLTLALAACGQKGDLVLPTQPTAAPGTVVAPAPATSTAAPAATTPVPATSGGSG